MKYLLCEVEQFFDEDFDGTLCKVRKVLQIFNSQHEAQEACCLFDPSNFDDYDTVIRVVAEGDLHKSFR